MPPTLICVPPRPLSAPGWAPRRPEPLWTITPTASPEPPCVNKDDAATPRTESRQNDHTPPEATVRGPVSTNERRRRHRDKLCNYCGEEGHYAITCSQAPATQPRRPALIKICYICKEQGHKYSHCPTVEQANPIRNLPHPLLSEEEKNHRLRLALCFRCGKKGHKSQQCLMKNHLQPNIPHPYPYHVTNHVKYTSRPTLPHQ